MVGMRKIPPEYEHPGDNLLIYISEYLAPYFHNMNFTPNGITTLSLLFGLTALCFLYNKQFIPFAIMYIISHFFDCMDGFYARKYDMVTEFGDMYDHVKDNVIQWSVLFIALKIGNFGKYPILIFISFLLYFLQGVHFGCQEKYYNSEYGGEYLKFTKKLCPADTKEELENIMKYTRLFGSFNFITFHVMVAHFLINKNSK